MDFLAVAGANLFLKRCRKMRWLLLGAAVSAVLGLCCILLCRNYLLYCLLTHFLINTLMTVICFGRCDRRQFFENWVAVYLVVLLLGGAFEWLQESGILSKSRGVAIAAGDGNVRSSSVSWEKKSLWQPCAPGMAWKRCAPDGVKRLLGQREPVKRSLYRAADLYFEL